MAEEEENDDIDTSGTLADSKLLYLILCLDLLSFAFNPSHTTFSHSVFEVLYLTQFLMDSPKSWTAHSPICTLDV